MSAGAGLLGRLASLATENRHHSIADNGQIMVTKNGCYLKTQFMKIELATQKPMVKDHSTLSKIRDF
jgi:hypothetical protein